MAALVLAAALTAGCAIGQSATQTMSSEQTQPYAGLEARPIKALAPERVEDLLAGRGAGYALAAELNHYPGPTHVLQLASELRLEPVQERRVREIFSTMQQDAERLGQQLVDLEAELDEAFGNGTITPAELSRLTAEIATVEGKLRSVHLAAHLELKQVLTPEQVARYDELRGYASAGAPADHGGHTPNQHGGSRSAH